MRVFVTGATGVLGRRLVERLTDRGHGVVGLVRDDRGADLVEACGGTPRRGDVLDPDSLSGATEGADAVVHAATAIPTSTKPTEEDWVLNDRVRLEGARNLLAESGDDVERFLFPSVVWVARQPDGSTFDEDADRNPDRSTRSAARVEDLLAEAGADRGFDVTVLRCGFFYAPDAAHTRQFGRDLLAGDMPIVGGGLLGRRDAELSLVHADDAARAFAEAIDAEASGTYHVVDDEPVTTATLLSALADRLDAPSPSRVPGWLARFFVGTETVATLTNPMPTTSERFRQDVGWEPRYPSYREGLDQVVATWLDDGTFRETADGYEWANSGSSDGV